MPAPIGNKWEGDWVFARQDATPWVPIEGAKKRNPDKIVFVVSALLLLVALAFI